MTCSREGIHVVQGPDDFSVLRKSREGIGSDCTIDAMEVNDVCVGGDC